MANHDLHRGLRLSLDKLGERIAQLGESARGSGGVENTGRVVKLEQLERRHKELADRLDALNREGPGFRHEVKVELEKMADDLSGTVENFLSWVDADERGDRELPGPLSGTSIASSDRR